LPESLLDRAHFGDIRTFAGTARWRRCRGHLAAISNDPMGKEFEGVPKRSTKRQRCACADGGATRRQPLRIRFELQHYGAAEGRPKRESDSLIPHRLCAVKVRWKTRFARAMR